jgi:hypothetical protein
MTTADKTLERMRRNPQSLRIEDVITVAKHYKLLMRTTGGSHYIFSFPGIKESVSVPAHKPIKPVYIKHLVELIDKIKE